MPISSFSCFLHNNIYFMITRFTDENSDFFNGFFLIFVLNRIKIKNNSFTSLVFPCFWFLIYLSLWTSPFVASLELKYPNAQNKTGFWRKKINIIVFLLLGKLYYLSVVAYWRNQFECCFDLEFSSHLSFACVSHCFCFCIRIVFGSTSFVSKY